MAKTCPSCGYQERDNQSMYCNKCGYPFPRNQPRRAAAAESAPAPVRRPAPRAARPAAHRHARSGGFLSFDTLIVEKHLKLIYVLGAAMIVLVSVMGIAGMFAKKTTEKAAEATTNSTFLNTTAIAEYPAGSPVFWIGFLIAASLLWRMFCELFALLSRAPAHTMHEYPAEEYEDAPGYGGDEYAEDAGGQGQMVECPKCHKIVSIDDLRECEHCGIQGCVNCIRSMGLLKKSLTCRECFEAK